MLCTGNQTEYCGGKFYSLAISSNADFLPGGSRLDMYQINASLPIPSTSSSTTTTGLSTTSTVPTATGGPYTVQGLPGWTYYGCWTESTTGRALSAVQNPASAVPVSVESCARACAGYTYMGVEYGQECKRFS
jgi:iron transport multicopper oxidase